jgi:nucleoid DNA-binding protein
VAKIVEAVRDYGPKLELKPTAHLQQIADWMAMRTGLNKSEVMMVLQETNEAIRYFTSQGAPVKLPGIGTFTPSIDREGTFKINFRADVTLKQQLNTPEAYTGKLLNKSRIGLDNAGYKALWDVDHADNPLEV